MSNEIKVSIVVAVYNAVPYLQECLDSLCTQTLKEIEIICVDDGSIDGSLNILYEYEKKDSRFCILENKKEGLGAAHARNMGLAHARGEYLLILDADDYFDLQLAEKTYLRAEATGADIVMFDAIWFDNETKEPIEDRMTLRPHFLPSTEIFSATDISENLFQTTLGAAWCQLYRRSFVKKSKSYFQSLSGPDDVFFTFSNLSLAERITVIQEKLLYYRFNNPNSLIQKKDKKALTAVELTILLKNWLIDHQNYQIFQKSFLIKFVDMCKHFLESFQNYENFELLYLYLRGGGLEELGFLSSEALDDLPEDLIRWLSVLQENTPASFLHLNYAHNDLVKTKLLEYKFPFLLLKKNETVAMYGAGTVGKTYFSQNTMCNYCKIVAWIDKNHEEIGFPVTGVDTFSKVEYDKVLIAVEDEKISGAIKQDLIKLGIPEEKIIWNTPYPE